jgi:hypothetical protein
MKKAWFLGNGVNSLVRSRQGHFFDREALRIYFMAETDAIILAGPISVKHGVLPASAYTY